jgi:putative ABC transport system permease protein
MQVSLNSAKYKTTASSWELTRRVSERIAAIPGVASVATVPSLPMERGLNNYLAIVGRDSRTGMSVESRAISPEYFQTLRIPLLSGRALSDSDRQGSAPVAVINERLMRLFFPDASPIGKQVILGNGRLEIVGVVSDVKEMGLDQPVQPTVYVPMPQVDDGMTAATNRWFLRSWIVRTEKPLDIDEALRSALRDTDPELPVAKMRSMTQVVSASIAAQRFITTLMSVFAALALVLTGVGLYGVLSYQVSQRTQDIGIRVAVGARPLSVIRLVLLDGMRLAVAGVAIGLCVAFALTRLIESQLYEVKPADPIIFAGTSLVLLAVAIAACLVPARRAMNVDPIVALRCE